MVSIVPQTLVNSSSWVRHCNVHLTPKHSIGGFALSCEFRGRDPGKRLRRARPMTREGWYVRAAHVFRDLLGINSAASWFRQ